MRPGGPAYGTVVEAFGQEIIAADGSIDRAKLGGIVFRDPVALRRLEAAVHPPTAAEVRRRVAQAKEPVVVVEAIKLIEAGMHRDCDRLWVVAAPRSIQIARLLDTRQLSKEEAVLRVDAQPPQEEKAALADRVIVNDGNLDDLRCQVRAAWATDVGPVDGSCGGGRQPESPTVGWTERPPGGTAPGIAPGTPPGQASIRPARRDDMEDAAGVAAVLNSVIAEKRYTAMSGHWTPEAERAYFLSLGPRCEVFVAEIAGRIVGFQSIEPFVAYTSTMDHVCHFGTFVHADFRGCGIGQALAQATLAFARAHGYEKAVVYVLSHNQGGLAFYRGLGFEERGVLARQTKIDGVYHDEVFMELHFADNLTADA
jgi:dephospho-CoA kinase